MKTVRWVGVSGAARLLGVLLFVSLTACQPAGQQPPVEGPLIYWVETSVRPWTSNTGAATASRYVGITMSAYETLDPIDVQYLEKLENALTLENAKGERVSLPVVSTDFSQTFTSTSRFISPGEIIVDASAASDTGWNIMRIGLPTQAAYDDRARSGEVAVPFRFDSAPVVKRVYFPDPGVFRFELRFSEVVDSKATNDALRVSSNGAQLTCTTSWEHFDPGTRTTLFVTCEGALPATLDLELKDGAITAGDVPVKSVDGAPFAEHLTFAQLELDGFGGRMWSPKDP